MQLELTHGRVGDLVNYQFRYSDQMLAVLTLGPVPGAKLKIVPKGEWWRTVHTGNPDMRDSVCVAVTRPSGEELVPIPLDPSMSEAVIVDKVYQILMHLKDKYSYKGTFDSHRFSQY